MQRGVGVVALYVEEERQQRASLLLRDVRYRLTASFSMTAKARSGGKSAEVRGDVRAPRG